MRQIKEIYISEPKKYIEKFKDSLVECVRKNNKTRRAFKILKVNKKLENVQFYKLKNAMALDGKMYSSAYNGFIIEEIEYKEDTIKKTPEEMIEEFKRNNKVKKIEDDTRVYSISESIQKRSKSHYNKHIDINKEKQIIGKYEGTKFYSPNGIIEYSFYGSFVKHGVAISGKTEMITYYKMDILNKDILNQDGKVKLLTYTLKSNTIDKKIKKKEIVHFKDIIKEEEKEESKALKDIIFNGQEFDF